MLVHKVNVGDYYGLWEVIGLQRWTATLGYVVKCKCHCGTVRVVMVRSMVCGHSKSCGCWATHNSSIANKQLQVMWENIKYMAGWDSYNEFYRWSLRTGFRIDAALERKDISYGFNAHNSYWMPPRVPRSPKPLGEKNYGKVERISVTTVSQEQSEAPGSRSEL